MVANSTEACLAEAAHLIIANAKIDAELGVIANVEKLGRKSEEEITLFKSVGVGP